jgi:hypothetical protein
MKNLTKEQSKRKAQIAQALTEVGNELQNAINQFNEQMTAAFAPIEELQGRYNELITEANGYIGTVHEQQEAYEGERSDAWHNGDSGQAYRDWMGEWSLDIGEIEVCAPNSIEEPAIDAADLLRELPDQP